MHWAGLITSRIIGRSRIGPAPTDVITSNALKTNYFRITRPSQINNIYNHGGVIQ